MRTVFSCALLALVSSEADDASLIQAVSARKHTDVYTRLVQLIHKSKHSSEACMPVVAGETAPIRGTFIANDGKRQEVHVGDQAHAPGSFCIPSSSLSLLERSFGLSTAKDFERTLASKSSTESAVNGKNKRTTTSSNKRNMWGISYPDTGEQAIAVGDKNTIMRLVGGVWLDETVAGDFLFDFRSVCIPDDNIERVVGTNGALFYNDNNVPGTKWEQETTWTGLSEEEKTLVSTLNFNVIYFADSGGDIMIVADGGYLLRWLAGEQQYILQKISDKGTKLTAVSCPDEGEGEGSLIVGDGGEVYMQTGRHRSAAFVLQTNIEPISGDMLPDWKDVRYDEDEGIGKGVAMLTGSSGAVYAMIPKTIDDDGTPSDTSSDGNMFVKVADLGNWNVNTIHVEPGNKLTAAGDGGRVYECLIDGVDNSKMFTKDFLTPSMFTCEPVKDVSQKLTTSDLHRSSLSDMADVFHIVGDAESVLSFESGIYTQLEYEDHKVTLKSVAFPSVGEDALAVGSNGSVLKYNDASWSTLYGGPGQGALGSAQTDLVGVCMKKRPSGAEAATTVGDGVFYNFESVALPEGVQGPFKSCSYGDADNNPLYIVGANGVILYSDDNSALQEVGHDLAKMVTLNYVTWSDDASNVIVVGDDGVILMRTVNGTFMQQASQTTANLYGADFPHSTELDQMLVVGANGTALVYGLPVPGMWNNYCKGIVQHREAGRCDQTQGKWKDLTADLYGVMYRDSPRLLDPVRVLATIVGAGGAMVQWGWNANGRNFQVMAQSNMVEQDLYSVSQSSNGDLTLIVGAPLIEEDEAEATIIRKNKDPMWVRQTLP